MYSLSINLANTDFLLSIEDKSLFNDFSTVFGKQPKRSTNKNVYVDIFGTEKYEVRANGSVLIREVSQGSAAWCVTCVFGNYIRRNVSKTICSLHGSSVGFENTAITLLGSSGKGKSTLSLELSNHFTYIGDEYGYLNLETGELWHEQYPVQIKGEGIKSLIKKTGINKLMLESEIFAKSYLVKLENTSLTGRKYRLKTILFPECRPDMTSSSITRISLSSVCTLILESAASAEAPALLLRRFLAMLANYEIDFYHVAYRDCTEAVHLLHERFL